MSRAQQLANDNAGEDWKKYLDSATANAKVAAGWAGQRANEGWEGLNHVAKERGGVDLNEQLGKLGLNTRQDNGYGRLERAEDGVISPHGGQGGNDDFFDSWDDHPASATAKTPQPAMATQTNAPAKKDDWDKDDEWKDF